MRLIVGLGNPGPAHADTRHNVGFRVVEVLAAQAGIRFRRHGEVLRAEGRLSAQAVTLAKPQSYMNRSGPVVAALIGDLGLDLSAVIVVHDDLDLEPGRLRIKARGGHGGHNGVLSIIDALESDRFARVKIGIGRPPDDVEPGNYVLAPVSARERAVLEEAVLQAAKAVECWVGEGLMAAMNRFNVKPELKDR
ncbi:MAG: aminoacyl-tRNA hydrolase [Nitrospirae bacterium]|nr:MAG: aminoacyl-tRNA hydrolase [Nitrospirota bacterium]